MGFQRLSLQVDRWEHEEVLKEVRRCLDEKPETMRIRRETVEHPFGKIKARGRDELSDEATAQREDRDVACRAGLQSDPRHKHSWDRDADRSNPGDLAPDQTRSRSKDRLDRSYLTRSWMLICAKLSVETSSQRQLGPEVEF